MELKEKFILVQLETSHWTAKKYSKQVTDEVDEAHGAINAGRFSKKLLVSKQLEDINSCLGKARTYHYKVTLPWGDDGRRLLPIAEYLDYTAKMEDFKVEHKGLVNIFISNYPELRKERKKQLNTLFDENDYPAERELITKFKMDYKFEVISDSSDLRVDISKGEANEIKKNIEAGLKDKINNAKSSIVERAKKAVEAAYEKLSDKNATFRDSLITNITDVVETIPLVNFDDDDTLKQLRKKLRKLDVPVDSLRKDKQTRKATSKLCKKTLKYIKTINFGGIVIEKEVEVKSTKVKRIKK